MVAEWIGLGIGLITFIGFGIKINSSMNATVENFKSDVSNKYVRKDVFKVMHRELKDDITEIKTDVKTLLRNGKR